MKSAEAIGGYFGIEAGQGAPYHKDAIALNSGRNAFEYILRARGYQHVYLPYYTCDALIEPIQRLNISYDFYSLDEFLEPAELPGTEKGSAFVYTNYFGLKADYIKKTSAIIPNLVIDACQAFFYKPIQGIDTFYSPRKFFGVPDGGYVFTDKELHDDFVEDLSVDRFSHLIKRIDQSAEEGYGDFVSNDASLNGQPIKKMSKLTKALLSSISYPATLEKRNENFRYLHESLKDKNEFQWIKDVTVDGPMVYPFLTADKGLRDKLIKNQVYVARYWPNVNDWAGENSFEQRLFNNMVPLPVDQRYGFKEMDKIIELVNRTD